MHRESISAGFHSIVTANSPKINGTNFFSKRTLTFQWRNRGSSQLSWPLYTSDETGCAVAVAFTNKVSGCVKMKASITLLK